MPKTLAGGHSMYEFPIPRMSFEFNPAGVGECEEFSLDIPLGDIEGARRLRPALDWITKPEGGMSEILEASTEDNVGGKLVVTKDEETVRVRFGFTPLPPRAELPADSEIRGWHERFAYMVEPQMEHLNGRQKVYQALAAITAAQYQFAVMPKLYDTARPVPPARFSFVGGQDVQEPRVVVTRQFDETLFSLTPQEGDAIKQSAIDYFATTYEPQYDTSIFRRVTIPNSGRIFGSGHFSFGQRSLEHFSEAEINDKDTWRDSRLQPGDVYYAQGHNLGDVPHSKVMAMVAVGSISRICRERQERLAV